MHAEVLKRLKTGRWTVETARRFKILCRNWILERGVGPVAAALMIVQPVAHAQSAPPPGGQGWVWYDKFDHEGKWHLGASDKRLHFVAGAIAGSWAALLAEHWGAKHPYLWGLLTGIAVGYLKEVYDMRRGSGTGEIADILATGSGGALGACIVLVKVRW